MTNITSDKEHSHNNTTFRFGCGRIQRIDDKVIQQIPYLAALVSIANHVSNIKDEDGHILLDTNINFHHFNVIIDALPFSAIYKVFVRIPDHDDFELIIMLADFLGLIGSVVPTLDEIDTFFFSAWRLEASIIKWAQHNFSLTMSDVAVLFITGLIRGDYDSTDDAVIDRIYWYTMFIISAHTVFHPILRSHLERACEQYFHLYKPLLVPRLHQLLTTTKQYEDRGKLSSRMFKIKNDESNDSVCKRISKTYIEDLKECDYSRFFSYCPLWRYHRDYEDYIFEKPMKRFTEDTLANVVADMINQCLDLPVRGRLVQQIYNCVAMRYPFGSESWIRRTLLHDVIEDDAVRESIRSLIIEGMPANIDKMREKHELFRKAMETYSEQCTLEPPSFFHYEWRPTCILNWLKEEIKRCEILLNRLIEDKSMLDRIEQRVYDRLYSLNLSRIRSLLKNRNTIRERYEDDAKIWPEKNPKEKLFQLIVERERKQKHQLRSSNKPQRRLKQF